MKMTKFERKENSLLKQLQSPMCPAQINLIQFSGGREVGQVGVWQQEEGRSLCKIECTIFFFTSLQSAQVYLVGTKCDLVEDGTRQRAVEASKVEAFAKGQLTLSLSLYPQIWTVNGQNIFLPSSFHLQNVSGCENQSGKCRIELMDISQSREEIVRLKPTTL